MDAPPGRLDASIRGTPRIAGSPEAGSVTYVTRSRVVGFPDYATVAVTQRAGRSYPVILSRLRFGGSDLGVNRARVTRRLEAQTPPADARQDRPVRAVTAPPARP